MRSSVSELAQVYYDHGGDPVEVYPRFCVDENLVRVGNSPTMANGCTLYDQMKRKPDSHICFYRSYALGDILLLTPIFNWLKEEYPACQITLATGTVFLNLFKYWDIMDTIDKRRVLNSDYDVGYYLNGILEQDHIGNGKSYKHRLDLYCDFMGIPVPKEPVFSLPYGEDEKLWASGITGVLRESGKPVIVMQLFGSTKIKSFALAKVMRIASALSYQYSVILVHNYGERIKSEAMDLTGRTTIHQLAAIIDHADAVVTMDSGVLWVAHCTQTPVIAMLGPTREQERMIYHRNYHVVNLSSMVGCEPCFERMTRCKGTIDCMNRSGEEEIIAEIKRGIIRLVST